MKNGDSVLKYIITSDTRRSVLGLFFHNLNSSFYLREVVRKCGKEVNAVKRELDLLEKGNILKKEARLNKVFFSLNKNYLFYDDLISIFAKNSPIATILYKNMPLLGRVRFIVLSSDFIEGAKLYPGEIHLLVVGDIVLPELENVITTFEKEQGKEVYFTSMTIDELRLRKRKNDPFLWAFLKKSKIMLYGSEYELMRREGANNNASASED